MDDTTKYPPHLSEFYSIVNSNKNRDNNNNNNNNVPDNDNINGGVSTLSNRNLPSTSNTPMTQTLSPPTTNGHRYNKSISSSMKSNSSCLHDLEMIITQRDIDQLISTLQQLHEVSNRYSLSLVQVANDTMEFSSVINDLTRLKICPNNNDIIKNLLDSSGLFQVISNHHLILANYMKEYLSENVNVIIDKVSKYYSRVNEEFIKFDKVQMIKLNKLQKDYFYTEDLRKKKQKQKKRLINDNLIEIRQNLNDLQLQLNEMELIRFNYYQDLIQFNDSIFEEIINKLATISKIHLEINENIARKNWPEGGLDQLLTHSDDLLFNKEFENDNDNDKEEGTANVNDENGSQVSDRIDEEEDDEEDGADVRNDRCSDKNPEETRLKPLNEDVISNDRSQKSSGDLITTSPHKRNDSKTSYFSMDNNDVDPIQPFQTKNVLDQTSIPSYDENDQSFSLPLTIASPTNQDKTSGLESDDNGDEEEGEHNDGNILPNDDTDNDDRETNLTFDGDTTSIIDQSSI